MGKKNPFAGTATARRRKYRYQMTAVPIEPWETQRWFQVLEMFVDTGAHVADLLGITRATYYRWKADDYAGAPTHFTQRMVYMGLFNELVMAASKRQPDTGLIPVKAYPDVAVSVERARGMVEECLSAAGHWFTMSIFQEPMPKQQQCILWLADYLKPGKKYLHYDIMADAKEDGFDRQMLFKAAEYLKVRRHRKTELMTKGLKATIHWWLDEAPDIAELDQSILDAE